MLLLKEVFIEAPNFIIIKIKYVGIKISGLLLNELKCKKIASNLVQDSMKEEENKC